MRMVRGAHDAYFHTNNVIELPCAEFITLQLSIIHMISDNNNSAL